MDAKQPQHSPVIGCGWIKRGEEHPIQSNTDPKRLNINGGINIGALTAEIRFDDTIDADSSARGSGTARNVDQVTKCLIIHITIRLTAKAACKKCFAEHDSFAPRLRTLLTEKLQIIGKERPKIAID